METIYGTIFVMSYKHLLRFVLYFFFDFPKSKCGGECNPTNKKESLTQRKVNHSVFSNLSEGTKSKFVHVDLGSPNVSNNSI